MSFRTQHDTVIDDDDESCPLCIEEFDLSDKNFKPCPCGYQICQFCYNNIKTHSEEGRCPNCRRVYDESTIQYRVPDADEFKADLALKHRKAAAAKKREAEKREIEASSRRNLAGVRVVQKNLVYVIGLNPTIRDESQLLQTLRGDQYFGQYGDIEKIVVSKAKPGGNPNQGIGVYVTFARKADAATCIAAVDGSPNGDRVLRAQYGTTKYCSSFLRNEQCNNRNCTFLHETGEDNDSFSRQDLSSMNTLSSQRVHPNAPTGPGPSSYSPYTHHAQPVRPPSHPIQIPIGAQPMRRQNSQDEAGNRINTDSSALPSSASWANKDSHVQRARRPSLAASRSSPSPKGSNAVVNKIEDLKRSVDRQSHSVQDSSRQQTPTIPEASGSSSRANRPVSPSPPGPREIPVLDELVKAVNNPDFRFIFSSAGLSPEELAYIENHPSMIDPYGGVKRRAMREKAEHERANQETDNQMLLHPNTNEEENLEGGSSQLGGEPEMMHSASTSGRNVREPLSAIQPPSQQTTTANSAIGSPVSAGHQFQGLNMAGRSLTPLQQQQLLLLKNAGGQHMGLMDQLQTTSIANSFEHNPQQRAGVYQNQIPQMTGMQGHARQSSRFSFVNDANAKNASNQRLVNQQTSTMQSANPNPLNVSTGQHGLGNHYFVSGVQGPPPGLKTAGTPPISGGGMFAQGHGFTSTMNNNLGLGTKQDANPDLMRELMRGRSATGGGGGGVQAHEAAKREFMFPFIQMHNTPPPLAPVSGLLSSLYGHHNGSHPDLGPQKQKKRGKKHRHANTSSGGGGVVDLADPSILQARMHQSAAGATPGQGLYGSQGQADEDFPPLGPTKPLDKRPLDTFRIASGSRATHGSNDSPFRSGTPVLPPGLPLPHGHPAAPFVHDLSPSTSALSSPQPGHISLRSGFSTPVQKLKELNPSAYPTPDAQTSSAVPSVPARTRTAAEISSGSPKPKSLAASRSQSDSLTTKKDKAREASPEKAAAPTTKDGKQSPEAHGKPVPIKLNLSMPTSGHASPSRTTTPNHSISSIPQLTNAASRPNTPLTGVSRASDSPAPRQARVLRVVDTSKSETPATPHYSTPPTKHLSRQPSLSTNSRPDTPNNVDFEYDIHTSASVSRASSPPPSRVGSAPVRTITKSQLKKERKLKAKQAEIKKEEIISTSIVAEEPVQAPIIGRKRKTKKAPTPTSEPQPSSGAKPETIDNALHSAKSFKNKTQNKPETSTQAKGSDKTARETASREQAPQSQPTEKDEKSEPWRSNNTTGQLLADSEASGIPVKDLFLERTSPLPVLLAQLHQSGDLDLNTHPLFNPPNLNQRSDLKCTADDYDILKKPIELAEEHRTRLLQGEPVHINADSDLLKYRCLITPTGCVLRHLSEEEENRYLELEKSLSAAWESLQEYPALTVTEPDATNRGGGLDALFATPEKFNIRWIDGAPENGLLSGSAKPSSLPSPPLGSANGFSTGSTASDIADAARASASASSGVTHTSVPRSSTAPKSTTSESHLGVSLEELMSMSDEELRAMIDEAQRELESSRKEVDIVDKKVMTLVKRNKKLVQQALSAAMEFVGSASDIGL